MMPVIPFHSRRSIMKICACLVAIIFCITTISWAAPQSVYSINVPEESGTVKGRYKGTSDKSVVLVQDAHVSVEAQKNLSSIISHLAKQYDINQVNIEGAAGKIDFDFFRRYPNKKVLARVVDQMIEKAILVGAEHAAMLSEKELSVYGVEDKQEYIENYEVCKTIFRKNDDLIPLITELEETLAQIKDTTFNEKLRALDHAVSAYHANTMIFTDYVQQIFNTARTQSLEIDPVRFVYTTLFCETMNDDGGTKKKLMDYGKLLEEIEDISYEFEDALAVTEKEKSLVKVNKNIRILKSLISLQALNKDIRYYTAHAEEFTSASLNAVLVQNGYASKPELANIDDMLNDVAQFYAIADTRSETLLDHALANMNSEGADTAVLVSGGFHTALFEKLLKERDISYVVITPQLTDLSESIPYKDIMVGTRTPYDLFLQTSFSTLQRIVASAPLVDEISREIMKIKTVIALEITELEERLEGELEDVDRAAIEAEIAQRKATITEKEAEALRAKLENAAVRARLSNKGFSDIVQRLERDFKEWGYEPAQIEQIAFDQLVSFTVALNAGTEDEKKIVTVDSADPLDGTTGDLTRQAELVRRNLRLGDQFTEQIQRALTAINEHAQTIFITAIVAGTLGKTLFDYIKEQQTTPESAGEVTRVEPPVMAIDNTIPTFGDTMEGAIEIANWKVSKDMRSRAVVMFGTLLHNNGIDKDSQQWNDIMTRYLEGLPQEVSMRIGLSQEGGRVDPGIYVVHILDQYTQNFIALMGQRTGFASMFGVPLTALALLRGAVNEFEQGSGDRRAFLRLAGKTLGIVGGALALAAAPWWVRTALAQGQTPIDPKMVPTLQGKVGVAMSARGSNVWPQPVVNEHSCALDNGNVKYQIQTVAPVTQFGVGLWLQTRLNDPNFGDWDDPGNVNHFLVVDHTQTTFTFRMIEPKHYSYTRYSRSKWMNIVSADPNVYWEEASPWSDVGVSAIGMTGYVPWAAPVLPKDEGPVAQNGNLVIKWDNSDLSNPDNALDKTGWVNIEIEKNINGQWVVVGNNWFRITENNVHEFRILTNDGQYRYRGRRVTPNPPELDGVWGDWSNYTSFNVTAYDQNVASAPTHEAVQILGGNVTIPFNLPSLPTGEQSGLLEVLVFKEDGTFVKADWPAMPANTNNYEYLIQFLEDTDVGNYIVKYRFWNKSPEDDGIAQLEYSEIPITITSIVRPPVPSNVHTDQHFYGSVSGEDTIIPVHVDGPGSGHTLQPEFIEVKIRIPMVDDAGNAVAVKSYVVADTAEVQGRTWVGDEVVEQQTTVASISGNTNPRVTPEAVQIEPTTDLRTMSAMATADGEPVMSEFSLFMPIDSATPNAPILAELPIPSIDNQGNPIRPAGTGDITSQFWSGLPVPYGNGVPSNESPGIDVIVNQPSQPEGWSMDIRDTGITVNAGRTFSGPIHIEAEFSNIPGVATFNKRFELETGSATAQIPYPDELLGVDRGTHTTVKLRFKAADGSWQELGDWSIWSLEQEQMINPYLIFNPIMFKSSGIVFPLLPQDGATGGDSLQQLLDEQPERGIVAVVTPESIFSTEQMEIINAAIAAGNTTPDFMGAEMGIIEDIVTGTIAALKQQKNVTDVKLVFHSGDRSEAARQMLSEILTRSMIGFNADDIVVINNDMIEKQGDVQACINKFLTDVVGITDTTSFINPTGCPNIGMLVDETDLATIVQPVGAVVIPISAKEKQDFEADQGVLGVAFTPLFAKLFDEVVANSGRMVSLNDNLVVALDLGALREQFAEFLRQTQVLQEVLAVAA